MSDEELASTIALGVCTAAALIPDNTPQPDKLAAVVLDLLRESRRQRLEGMARLEEIQRRLNQPDISYPSLDLEYLHYLLTLITDLRSMLHDATQDSEAYQCGYREGVTSEREACAKLIDAENEAAHSEPLGYLAGRIRERGN